MSLILTFNNIAKYFTAGNLHFKSEELGPIPLIERPT